MNASPWEAGAEWLRRQPYLKQLMINCYMDEGIVAAAERFSKSEESAEVARLAGNARAWLQALTLAPG